MLAQQNRTLKTHKNILLACFLTNYRYIIFIMTSHTKDWNAELFAAVKAQDFERLQEALAHGADPNAQDKEGNTPLHWVVALAEAKNRTAANEEEEDTVPSDSEATT